MLDTLFTETVSASESTNSGATGSGAAFSGGCSIKKCIDLVESIEELSDQEKADATSIMKCKVNREIFMNFTNPGVRLLWIKGEIAKQVSLLYCP